MKRVTKIFGIVILLFSLIAALSLFFVKNINVSNNSIKKNSKYMIIGKRNVFAVFENKLAIKIPFEIQLDKEMTVGELSENKEYDKLLESLNRIFPEKIEAYKVVKLGTVKLDVKNSLNIPETSINDKRYILTSSITNLFQDFYKKEIEIPFEDVVIDILNGNGRAGYSKKTGEKLKEKFKLNYTTATYEKRMAGSYVIINNLPKEKIESISKELNENYIKIKDVSSVPSTSNLIIVLGDDKTATTQIEVNGNSERIKEVSEELKKSGYNSVETKESELKSAEDDTIEYANEDYYTAYKIGQKFGIEKLVENNELSDMIKLNLK